jgi:hypothetical protein
VRVILRLISQKSERLVWNWIQVAQNKDVQRVFVNTRVRLVVTCKGEVMWVSRSTAGLSMTLLQAVSLFVCHSIGYERRNKIYWFSWKLLFNLSFFGEVAHTTSKIAVFFSSE